MTQLEYIDILNDTCKIRYSEAPFKIKYKLPQHLLQ